MEDEGEGRGVSRSGGGGVEELMTLRAGWWTDYCESDKRESERREQEPAAKRKANSHGEAFLSALGAFYLSLSLCLFLLPRPPPPPSLSVLSLRSAT
jgi:hypothetical protein